MDRKQTAWKKSRTFGDIFGGRRRPKIPDRIVRRLHSLHPPSPHDETPIFIVDNPSRNFYFPLSADEIRHKLSLVPKRDWSQITHIWLRRAKKAEYDAAELPLAEFVCGSGVRAVVLYPWPTDLRMPFGEKMPSDRILRNYARYRPRIEQSDGKWYLQWESGAAKDYCIEQLLYHEIGHHVDWYYRHWSKANRKAAEEFANQYAFEKTSMRTMCYRDDSEPDESS